MNTKFNKIVKTAAVGVFFMALFMNVKLSLTDPFVSINNDALAQSSSSGSGPQTCYKTITDMESSSVLFCGSCTMVQNSTKAWTSGSSTCTPS